MDAKQRLLQYLKPLKKQLILALVFALIFVVANLAQPFLIGRALDASSEKDYSVFYIYLIVSFVLAILGTLFDYFFELIVMNASQKAISGCRRPWLRCIPERACR